MSFPTITTPCPTCGHPREQPDPKALRALRWPDPAKDPLVSLRETAKALGVSAAYLSDVELGHRSVTARILEHYLETFNPNGRTEP